MDWRIGVIGRREQAAVGAPPTVAAVVAFAASVMARHAPQTMYADHLDMALARPSDASQVNHFHAGPRIGLSAELTVHDHALFPQTTQVMAAPRRQGAGFGEAETRALFERLFSRRARLSALDERRAPPPPDVLAKAPSASVEPSSRVERVLPRPAAPPAAPEAAGPPPRIDPATVASDWGAPIPPPAQPKPVVLAAPEIRRVANQVIREIDHRISARRERMGER